MATSEEHYQRWIWFLDVVFGAIVALGITEFEPILSHAWSQGIESLSLSVFVAFSIFSFVVYDISVYHTLVKEFQYRISFLSFMRFYLDLIMAFALYILLMRAFEEQPNWIHIITAVSFWHLGAFWWHILARREYNIRGDFLKTVMPHILFIAIYWVFTLSASLLGSTFALIVLAATIFSVSLFRWRQMLKIIPAA